MKNLIPRMATINEASEITGLARYFIRQLAITNKVKTVKAGKKYLINVDKLIEYLNADSVQSEEKIGITRVEK